MSWRTGARLSLLILCMEASAAIAQAQEVICPTPEEAAKVQFPDASGPRPNTWYATRYRVEPPKLTAESKLAFDEVYLNPYFVQCRYKVEAGGVIRVQVSRSCEKGRGAWNDQGENLKCTGQAVSECAVVCK